MPQRLDRGRRQNRWAAWVTREIYGTPYVVGLRTLDIGQDDLLAVIRGGFDGKIDLTGW